MMILILKLQTNWMLTHQSKTQLRLTFTSLSPATDT